MPTSFSLNFVKMIAFSAVLALILSLAGRQAGFITYGLLNPAKELPAFNETVLPYKKQVVAAPVKPTPVKPTPAKPKPTSAVVKKSVPVHKKGPMPTSAIKPVALIQETPKKSPNPGIRAKKQSTPLPNVIELDADPTKKPVIDTSGVYAIQTGVFTARKNAEENSDAFRMKGYSPSTVILSCDGGSKIYAIRIGRFSDKAEAKTAFTNFQKRECKDAILVPLYSKQGLMSFCKKK